LPPFLNQFRDVVLRIGIIALAPARMIECPLNVDNEQHGGIKVESHKCLPMQPKKKE
jgi:hypothetical protein